MAHSVRLRKVRLSDVKFFEQWWKEPEGNLYDMGSRDARPPQGYGDQIRRAVLTGRTQTWFTVELKGHGPVGYVLYRHIDPRERSAEIGIRLGQAHWEKGYGTAATFLVLHHLFVEQGFRRIWLNVAEFNKRAQGMYRKMGFSEVDAETDGELTWIRMEIGLPRFRETLEQFRDVFLNDDREDEPELQAYPGSARVADDQVTPTHEERDDTC